MGQGLCCRLPEPPCLDLRGMMHYRSSHPDSRRGNWPQGAEVLRAHGGWVAQPWTDL